MRHATHRPSHRDQAVRAFASGIVCGSLVLLLLVPPWIPLLTLIVGGVLAAGAVIGL